MSEKCSLVFYTTPEGWLYSELAGLAWLEGRRSSRLGISRKDGIATLRLPAKVDGLPVYGLSMTFDKYDDADELIIPEGVALIAGRAFALRRRLKRVKIPSTLREVAGDAFAGTALSPARKRELYAIRMADPAEKEGL